MHDAHAAQDDIKTSRRHLRRNTACAWLLLIACAGQHAFAADVFRWVDEDGRVHFSDKKPESTNVEQVKIPTTAVGEPDEGELRRRELLRRAEEDFQRNRRSNAETTGENADSQEKSDACDDARIRYNVLSEGMPVYWTAEGKLRPSWRRDTYQGSRRYVEDGARPKLRTQAQDDIFRYCRDPDNYDALMDTYDDWIDEEWCGVLRVRVSAARETRARTPRSELEQLEQELAQKCTG